MSAVDRQMGRMTVPQIQKCKGGEPLVALTAYSAPMASILDPYVDIFIVGDSVGMVLYGMESTLDVSLEMMIGHGAAVVRGSQKACVTVDMPFGSYQESRSQAFRNAAKVMKRTGCDAIKLEGGEEMAETISFLTTRGIPVMGHIGLTPQSINTMGGYRVQGKSPQKAAELLQDAIELERAGAFSIVLECVPAPLAKLITEKVHVPTIGIGAGPDCDGQVQVIHDLLGFFEGFSPKHAKKYATLSETMLAALKQYASDVSEGVFPSTEHSFGMDEELLDALYGVRTEHS